MKLSALAAVAATFAFAGASQAGEAPATDTTQAQARRVVRDKETGQLRAATAQEAKAMAEADKAAGAVSSRPTQLVVRQHASGARSIALPMEMMSTLKAERLPSGALKVTHDGADDAHAAPVHDDRPTE
jgi:hypothetical protein